MRNTAQGWVTDPCRCRGYPGQQSQSLFYPEGVALTSGTSAIEAIGRNPDATGLIRTNAIILAAFAESLGIFAFVIAFLLQSKAL